MELRWHLSTNRLHIFFAPSSRGRERRRLRLGLAALIPPEPADLPRKVVPGRKLWVTRAPLRMRRALRTPGVRLCRYDAAAITTQSDPTAKRVLLWSIGRSAFRQTVPKDRPTRLPCGPKRKLRQENV